MKNEIISSEESLQNSTEKNSLIFNEILLGF